MTDADSQQHATGTVGQKLKALRELRNIGTLEVASQLHLDNRVINALEEDDYSALPDPIFVRGYIRSYSKIVGGDADELVNLFERDVGVREHEIIPEIKYPAQTSSSDKPVKAFTYLLSLGLVILLIAWWQSNFLIDPQTTDSETALANEENAIAEMPMRNDERIFSTYAPLIPEQIPMDLLDIGEFSAEETVILGGEEGQDAAVVTEDYGPETEFHSGQELAPGLVSPEQTVQNLEDGPDSLVLSLTADSWIEITDANNQKLYMDLVRSGNSLSLRGTAPFDILLGFAQGVTMEFNGVPFDPAPHSRAGVAKFTLGE